MEFLGNLVAKASVPVEDPLIKEAISRDTGELVTIASVIGELDDADAFKLRHEVDHRRNIGDPQFICARCQQEVALRLSVVGRWYFKHAGDESACPFKTGDMTREAILAQKFAGAREGKPHMYLKELLVQSLQADTSFADVRPEGRWKSSDYSNRWRQPDVSAVYEGRRIAFEIQLSTTFVDVIEARRNFYREEKSLVVWFVRDYDPRNAKTTEKDIVLPNRSNALVVTPETTLESIRRNVFMLDCIYPTPHVTQLGEIVNQWVREQIEFRQLKCDDSRQQIYYVDYDSAKKLEIERHRHKSTIEAQQKLREEFYQMFLQLDNVPIDRARQMWFAMLAKLRQAEIPVFDRNFQLNDLRLMGVLSILYSAKMGKPIRCGNPNLLGVANTAFGKYKGFLRLFGALLVKHEHWEKLLAQDRKKNGWLEPKANAARQLRERQHPDYVRPMEYDALLKFLFPEVAEHIT